MRKEELQGANGSFKEQRNEPAAGGVDEVGGKKSMCICVWVSFSRRKTTATERQMGQADGNGPAERETLEREGNIAVVMSLIK